MATGHTSAGGALKLSPPCLAFRLAARSVDAANMEEAEMKSKVEGAGVTGDHITVLGMRDFQPEGSYFLTSPAQGLTSRSGGQGGSQGSRTPSTLTEEELESRKQGSSPVKIPQPLHAKFLMKED